MTAGMSPKDWSPRWKGKPWIAAGHEEWQFDDALTWLAREAAGMGLWSRVHTLSRSGGGTWWRFDSNKLYKVLPKVAEAKNFPIDPKELESLKDLKGAILIEDPHDVTKLDLYWNKYEFQGDWGEMKDENPDPYR